MKNDLLKKRRVILFLTVIACLIAVWQVAGAAKNLLRLSHLKQHAAERKAFLDERKETVGDYPESTFPQFAFIEPTDMTESLDENDLICSPQRHDITVKEMKSVKKDTPVSEMASRFGGVHGSAGSGIIHFMYFLEDGMYAWFDIGTAKSEDGTEYYTVTNLYIGDSADPENGFRVF